MHACVAVQVSEAEAAAGALGPAWPSARVLVALQEQCREVAESVLSLPHAAQASQPGLAQRANSLAQLLIRIAQVNQKELPAGMHAAGISSISFLQ